MSIQKEIIWAVSGTGEDFQCVDASFALEQQAEIERLTSENERLRALITTIAERHSRVGDLEYDDVISAAVSSCQQQEDTK